MCEVVDANQLDVEDEDCVVEWMDGDGVSFVF